MVMAGRSSESVHARWWPRSYLPISDFFPWNALSRGWIWKKWNALVNCTLAERIKWSRICFWHCCYSHEKLSPYQAYLSLVRGTSSYANLSLYSISIACPFAFYVHTYMKTEETATCRDLLSLFYGIATYLSTVAVEWFRSLVYTIDSYNLPAL